MFAGQVATRHQMQAMCIHQTMWMQAGRHGRQAGTQAGRGVLWLCMQSTCMPSCSGMRWRPYGPCYRAALPPDASQQGKMDDPLCLSFCFSNNNAHLIVHIDVPFGRRWVAERQAPHRSRHLLHAHLQRQGLASRATAATPQRTCGSRNGRVGELACCVFAKDCDSFLMSSRVQSCFKVLASAAGHNQDASTSTNATAVPLSVMPGPGPALRLIRHHDCHQ